MDKLGNITLYNADCMEIMKGFSDNQFDLAIVDPPYGLSKDSSNGRGKLKGRTFNRMDILRWDKAPDELYFNELFRVSKNQIIWGGNYFPLKPSRCILCWDKVQPWENFSQIELAWTSFDSPAQIFKFDNRTGDKIHPTQKPIQLYKWLIKKYTKEGQTILDTHLGSGSSAIAAHDYGYEFTGIELDSEYYEAAKKRISEHQRQLSMF